METRANYILIGAFTILGVLAALGFFLWLAKYEVDRTFAYYDVRFESVAGLGEAGDVRFNGLPVGQVVALGLDPDDPALVRVTLEVGADTPISAQTVARLEFQGVTGVSYVSLEGAGGAPLAPVETGNPLIRSEKSAVQNLFEGAPQLLEKAILLLEEVREVVNPENRAAVTSILGNLDSASGELDKVLKDFSALSADLSAAAREVGAFTGTLKGLTGTASQTLTTADEMLRTATQSLRRAETVIANAATTLESAEKTFDSANTIIDSDLKRLIASLDQTAKTVGTVAEDLSRRAGSVAGRIEGVVDTAMARLDQAEATFAKLDAAIDQAETTLKSADTLAQNTNTLVTGEGTALVADARRAVQSAQSAIDSVNRVVAEDVPAVMADIRAATAEANRLITAIGPKIESGSTDLSEVLMTADTALKAATDTFGRANATLAALDQTLDSADQAFVVATTTFTSANKVMEEDLGAIFADARRAVAKLEVGISEAAGDLPLITGDVRKLIADARNLVGNLDKIVDDNSEEIEVFAQAGLPQFVRFVQEARQLVQNLERLTAKIERDPARFLLGTQAPSFER